MASTVERLLGKPSRGFSGLRPSSPSPSSSTVDTPETEESVDISPYFERESRRKRRTRGRRGRGSTTDPEAKAIDAYLNDADKQAVIAKETSKVELLVDVIDNMNRAWYGVAGGMHEAIKSVKYDKESPHQAIKDIAEGAWKGLKRETRHSARELAEYAAPEFMKEMHERTKFHVFGIETDVLGLPLLAAEIGLDPSTYLGFGAVTRLTKGALKSSMNGAKAVSVATIGEEATEKIIDGAVDSWYKKLAGTFSITSLAKRKVKNASGEVVSAEDLMEKFIHARQSSRYDRIEAMQDALSVLGNTRKAASKGTSRQIYEAFQKAEGEAGAMYADLFAKEMGVSVSDVIRVNSVRNLLDDAAEQGLTELPKDHIKMIANFVDEMDVRGAKRVAKLLVENRGFKREVKKIAKIEKNATVVFAKAEYKTKLALLSAAIKGTTKTEKALSGSLREGIREVKRLVKSDVADISSTLKGLEADVSNFILKDAHPDLLGGIKDRFAALRDRLKNITTETVDITKGVQKIGRTGDVPVQHIEMLIRRLEIDMGQLSITKLGASKGAVLGDINQVFSSIKRNLRSASKLRVQQLNKMADVAQLSTSTQERLAKEFADAVSRLGKRRTEILREIKQAAVKYERTIRGVGEFSKTQERILEKTFITLQKGAVHQTVIGKMRKASEEIAKKHIEALPKDIQPLAWKFREMLDDMGTELAENGFPRLEKELLYVPRGVTKDTFDKVSNAAQQSSTGFTKHRKFVEAAAFNRHMEKLGAKPMDDLTTMILTNSMAQDAMIARKNLREGLISRFAGANATAEAGKKAIPAELMRGMEFVMEYGSKQSTNPVWRTWSNFYSKTLNITKWSLTGLNPAFIGRNLGGIPFFLSTAAGIKQALNLTNYIDGGVFRWAKGDKYANQLIETPMGKASMEHVRGIVQETGYFMNSFVRGNTQQSINASIGRVSDNAFLRPLSELRNFAQRMMSVAAHSEDYLRSVILMGTLKDPKWMEKGAKMSMDEYIRGAAKAAKDAAFDYNLITSPADKFMDSIIGFWTFPRKNLPRQMLNILNQPKEYASMSKIINKMSNREDLTDEEVASINDWDRDTFMIVGTGVDGIRDFYSLGMTPVEEAYRTVNSVTQPGTFRERFERIWGQRMNPVASTMLDWIYGKDSFRGKPIGNQLPSNYTHVIPEGMRKVLGLRLEKKPKWRGGEIVGEEDVLTGDPDTIFKIRRLPPISRIINEIAQFSGKAKQKEFGKGLLRFTTGIRSGEIDPKTSKKFRGFRIKKGLREKATEKGAPKFERVFKPKE